MNIKELTRREDTTAGWTAGQAPMGQQQQCAKCFNDFEQLKTIKPKNHSVDWGDFTSIFPVCKECSKKALMPDYSLAGGPAVMERIKLESDYYVSDGRANATIDSDGSLIFGGNNAKIHLFNEPIGDPQYSRQRYKELQSKLKKKAGKK